VEQRHWLGRIFFLCVEEIETEREREREQYIDFRWCPIGDNVIKDLRRIRVKRGVACVQINPTRPPDGTQTVIKKYNIILLLSRGNQRVLSRYRCSIVTSTSAAAAGLHIIVRRRTCNNNADGGFAGEKLKWGKSHFFVHI